MFNTHFWNSNMTYSYKKKTFILSSDGKKDKKLLSRTGLNIFSPSVQEKKLGLYEKKTNFYILVVHFNQFVFNCSNI